MAVLPISRMGSEVLKRRAAEVTAAGDPALSSLVNDMIETARNYAAPAAAAVPARGQTAARAERRGSHRPWADRPKSSAGAADLAAARKVSRGNGTLSAVNAPAAPADAKSSDSEWREF